MPSLPKMDHLRGIWRLGLFWLKGLFALLLLLGFLYFLAMVNEAFYGMVVGAVMLVAAVIGTIYELRRGRQRRS